MYDSTQAYLGNFTVRLLSSGSFSPIAGLVRMSDTATLPSLPAQMGFLSKSATFDSAVAVCHTYVLLLFANSIRVSSSFVRGCPWQVREIAFQPPS